MDDSAMFIQWAMETLQHEELAAALDGDALPSLQGQIPCSGLENGTAPTESAAAQEGGHHRHRASSGDGDRENWPGGAAVEKDGWSSNSCSVGSTTYPPVSGNLGSTMAQPSIHDVPEPAHGSPPSRKRSVKSGAGTGTTGRRTSSSPEPCVQEHVMAERKRREKINRRFIELSTVIPGLKKMDKATILADAARYVKEQQEKLKELEDRSMRSVDPVVKRPCIARKPEAAGATTTTTTMAGSSLPEIEARIWERNVMVRILCEDGKGVLIGLLAEVEGLHLSITHTNVAPFPACTLSITIMAKVDEGFNISPEDIAGKLDATLRRRRQSQRRS